LDGTSGSLGSVSATIFVEERYDMVDGELIITDSRLLSEDEVMAIGIDNFEDLNTSPMPNAALVANSRGKLTIAFSGLYVLDGKGISCNLCGSAKWDVSVLNISGENIPATGEDFIGITWSGEFTASSHNISGKYQNGSSISIYNPDSIPNGGRVWSFNDIIRLSKYTLYAKDINLNMIIKKNVLEGNGNTAEAVLKYIHTYSKVNGSISIAPGNKTVAGSINLSNTEKQWSLVCTVTDIPY